MDETGDTKERAMIATGLLIAALVICLLGLLDHPTVNATRCLCLALALIVLAQLVGTR